MQVQGLDDVDIRTLLQLETDLTDQSLDAFLEFIRQHYNLSGIEYYCRSFRGRSKTNPFIARSHARDFIDKTFDHYKEFADPLFSSGARSVLPIDWARLPRIETNIRHLFDDSSHRGADCQGLTIPVRGPANGLWALFSVTSDENEHAWSARRHDLMKDLVHVAYYVHQRAYDLHAKDAPIDLDAITKREIEALEWSAEGKSPAEIAILMRISLETVKAHLDSARFKLQALNRVHAVTKAIRAGLIR